MKARDDQIILLPCSGRDNINIQRGHIFLAYGKKDANGKRDTMGFITRDIALKKYGAINCFFSTSDTICPICAAAFMDDVEINLIT